VGELSNLIVPWRSSSTTPKAAGIWIRQVSSKRWSDWARALSASTAASGGCRRAYRIPGVLIPDEIFDRLARAGSAAAQGEVGVEITAEQVRWVVGNGWSGLYILCQS
jgi:hypothetical protein